MGGCYRSRRWQIYDLQPSSDTLSTDILFSSCRKVHTLAPCEHTHVYLGAQGSVLDSVTFWDGGRSLNFLLFQGLVPNNSSPCRGPCSCSKEQAPGP